MNWSDAMHGGEFKSAKKYDEEAARGQLAGAS